MNEEFGLELKSIAVVFALVGEVCLNDRSMHACTRGNDKSIRKFINFE